MFKKFTDDLRQALAQPLPGKTGHAPLKPYLNINRNIDIPQIIKPRIGAVMALIYPVKNIPHLLFIERPVYNGVHSGQIAFPGGKIEPEDPSYMDAALRETHEEIGLSSNNIQVVGSLTEVFVFASNFMVYPFVGIVDTKPHLILEKNEVASVIELPLHTLFIENIIKEKPIKNALGFTLMAPYYDIEGKTLWGATAMMVSELCTIIKNHNIRLV
jgi:8-oxo-dGTP pyrophosphatase MutT (NUDIX family)